MPIKATGDFVADPRPESKTSRHTKHMSVDRDEEKTQTLSLIITSIPLQSDPQQDSPSVLPGYYRGRVESKVKWV